MSPFYKNNLAVLQTHYPTLHNSLSQHASRDWIWRDYNGTQIPALVDDAGEWPIDEEPDSPVIAHYGKRIMQQVEEGADFLYLMGLGAGTLLRQIYSSVICQNRGILVIEPSWDVFRLALHVTDFRDLFQAKRIFWAIGDTYLEQIEALFENTLCHAAAKPIYHAGTRLILPEIKPQLEELTATLKKEITQRKKVLTQKVNSLPERLREKQGKPKRIWTYSDLRGKAQYSIIQHRLIEKLLYELQKLGYETEYTVMGEGRYYPPYYRIYQLALFEPDLIFLCNETPATEISLGADFSRSLPIPKMVWFADDPLYGEHLLERYKLTADETYLVADYEWKDTLQNHGATQIHFMPGAATSTEPGEVDPSRQCQIVFVGQVRDQRAFFNQLSPEWKRYCEKVIAEKLRFPRKKVRDAMQQFPMPFLLEADRMDEFRQKLLWEANTRFRVNLIAAFLNYDIHIYGNPDWAHLIPHETFQAKFKGVLPFDDLFTTYRSAEMVLNIHSLQSYTCMNVRDFDVPAAGGFLISDWLPKADEVYEPGFVSDLPLQEANKKEVFFYRSIPELKQLIEYFLEHPAQRETCMQRARAKVLQKHLYKHRAEFMHNRIAEIQIPLE